MRDAGDGSGWPTPAEEDGGLTEDGFLGGRLRLLQPRRGYRAGMDPVLLAAAVPARPGESVLELGCGVGTALLCLAARVAGLDATGVEVQPRYAALAAGNARRNGLAAEIVAGDVRRLPATIRDRRFDHVLANPPWFETGARTPGRDAGRDTGRAAEGGPSGWARAGLRRVRPGGSLTLILPPDALPACLAEIGPRAGVTLYPLLPREGREATRILLAARAGSRAPLRIAAPQVIHAGQHDDAVAAYTPPVAAILRDAAAWPWAVR